MIKHWSGSEPAVSAANILSGSEPPPVASKIQTVLTGANADILAAPPAGFGYLITDMFVSNNDAAQTAVVLLTEAGLLLYGNSALAASASATLPPHVSVAAVNLAISGSSASVTMHLAYALIPLNQIFRFNLALTDNYQAVDLTSIPTGYAACPTGAGLSSATPGTRVVWAANQDGAGRTIQMRLIKGGVTHVAINTATSQNQRVSTPVFIYIPVLTGADTLELKTTAALSTPGKVTVGFVGALVRTA